MMKKAANKMGIKKETKKKKVKHGTNKRRNS